MGKLFKKCFSLEENIEIAKEGSQINFDTGTKEGRRNRKIFQLAYTFGFLDGLSYFKAEMEANEV